jgi:hypothetical protein
MSNARMISVRKMSGASHELIGLDRQASLGPEDFACTVLSVSRLNPDFRAANRIKAATMSPLLGLICKADDTM